MQIFNKSNVVSPLVDDDKTTQSGINQDSIGALNQQDNDKLANFEAIQE